MRYTVKPIVCDYAVCGDGEIICICNIKRNAELIADILTGDSDYCSYTYDRYPYAKYNVIKKELV